MLPKKGPVTRDELMSVWASAVDQSYREPLQSAGDGGGLEIYSQVAEQLARVSRAIDITTQALYILPHSGQTDDPASGEQFATVTLTVTRGALIDKPLVLEAGQFVVAHQTTDYGDGGGVLFTSGRLYTLVNRLFFAAGETGPFDVQAVAEKPGWGYNNPLPGTISLPVQIGSNFENVLATVVAADLTSPVPPPFARVKSINQADMFVPDHVGQYIAFTGGANLGKIARIIAYVASPDPSVPVGSTVGVDLIFSVNGPSAGTFQQDELLTLPGGTGRVIGVHSTGGFGHMVYRLLAGTPAVVGNLIIGLVSGATLTVQTKTDDDLYISEAPSGGVGGASWRILDWVNDWGLTITNVLSPVGGKLAILDELGNERDLSRTTDDPDDIYRQRVATLADVVTPNAIKRALSRALGALPWTFREVGSPDLPGLYFDGGEDIPIATPHGGENDAYDTFVWFYSGALASGVFFDQEAVIVDDTSGTFYARGFFGGINAGVLTLILRDGVGYNRPVAGTNVRVRGVHSGAIFTTTSVSVPPLAEALRFHRWFNTIDYRGYFIVEVARLPFGDFGFAYDVGARDAYDVGEAFDGYAEDNATVYKRAWTSVSEAHAGGVGWDFEQIPPIVLPVTL